MKKSLLLLALGAMGFGAQAASVTLYGTADGALSYQYSKQEFNGASNRDQTYGLESGALSSSKFGLKGVEELGNGYSVGFKLENGFSLDDGRFSTGDRLFGREAALTVAGPFGELAAGRMGALTSGAGTYDIFQANADVFDGGVGNIGAGYWNATSRYDNMLTYATPDMAGFKAYAQYSFAANGTEDGNERNNDRYWGVGATYNVGALGLVAVVDSVMPESGTADHDSYTVSLGGNYDFGTFKPFIGAQYGKHMSIFGVLNNHADEFSRGDIKGYAVSAGSIFNTSFGELSAGLFWARADGSGLYENEEGVKVATTLDNVDTYGVGLVNAYPLSKRTKLYAGVGATYSRGDVTYGEATSKYKETNAQALVGLSHQF